MCRLFAVLLLLPSLGLAQDKKGTKYAFIVAVSKYDEATSGLKALPFTVKDVEGFRDALLATGYKAENVRLLHDDLPAAQNPGLRLTPEKGKILADLSRLMKVIDPEDSLIVVLNGHGVHFKGNKTSHFCPLDADLNAKENLLPMDGDGGLYPLLEKCRAKSKLLIAGMCRNDPKDFPADSQAAEQIDLSTPETPPAGIAALYSCEAGQKTYFDKEKGSYFFNHLTAAWRGEYAGDDDLTLDSVFTSVRTRTKKDVFTMSGGLKDQFPEVRRKYDGTWAIPKMVRLDSKPVASESPIIVPTEETKDFGSSEVRTFEITKGLKMKFCRIPAGKATLGSPADEEGRMNDEKEHDFETKGFWLGKYEVTQEEWKSVMGKDKNPSKFKGLNLPVENVSWNECQQFVEKCAANGVKLNLPHEDEWEYACRGGRGNKRTFYWGDALNGDKANCFGILQYGTSIKGEYKMKTTEVGYYEKYAPHPWGLCDVSGNVWEWCANLFSPQDSFRVVRGGSWNDATKDCRSAHRGRHYPTDSSNLGIGFRLVIVP